jgi:hypothetical protein
MKQYTKPSIEVIDMEVRDVICDSDPTVNTGTNANNPHAPEHRDAWSDYEGR